MRRGCLIALGVVGVLVVVGIVAFVLLFRNLFQTVTGESTAVLSTVTRLCASGPSEAGIRAFYEQEAAPAFRSRYTLAQFTQLVQQNREVFSQCDEALTPPTLDNPNLRSTNAAQGGTTGVTFDLAVAGRTLAISALPQDGLSNWRVTDLAVR
jgi:hypothetical protein